MAVGRGPGDAQHAAGPGHPDLGREDPEHRSGPARLVVAALGERDAQELGDYSLDLHDPLRLAEPCLEAGHPPAQALVLDRERIPGWPATGMGEVVEPAEAVQPAPLDEMGAVQPLPPEQRDDGPGLAGGVRLLDDPQLVLGGEGAADRALSDLGVGHGRASIAQRWARRQWFAPLLVSPLSALVACHLFSKSWCLTRFWQRGLPTWVTYYNVERTHTSLGGITPMAALVNNLHGNHS